MDKKNSQVFSAVAVPMSVAVAVVVVVAAGIMCFVANGGEGAADGLLPTPALIGTGTRRPCRQRYAFPVRIPGCKPGADKGGA